jgi:hypothetical protein
VAKKTKISNGDLTALFYERIRASSGCPVGIHRTEQNLRVDCADEPYTTRQASRVCQAL